MRWDVHGPQMTLCQACATGVDVVGTAADLVRRGKVDVAIAVSYEATNGFDHPVIDDEFVPGQLAALIAYGMAPDAEVPSPAKPFDKHRTGPVGSEAAGCVIVESAEHAAARGREAWATVEGYATLGEGYHPSSPESTGRWEQAVMEEALRDAGATVDEVDAIIAHGTATRKGDDAEINAINALFGDRAQPLPVTSIKGHMGHPGAASGCLATIAAALALREGSLVHTAGTTEVEDTARFDVITEKPRPLDLRKIMINAFGFGGQDSSLLVGHPSAT
jgi:3-oxoacyl-[acyl-carrier-protein] synthase II